LPLGRAHTAHASAVRYWRQDHESAGGGQASVGFFPIESLTCLRLGSTSPSPGLVATEASCTRIRSGAKRRVHAGGPELAQCRTAPPIVTSVSSSRAASSSAPDREDPVACPPRARMPALCAGPDGRDGAGLRSIRQSRATTGPSTPESISSPAHAGRGRQLRASRGPVDHGHSLPSSGTSVGAPSRLARENRSAALASLPRPRGADRCRLLRRCQPPARRWSARGRSAHVVSRPTSSRVSRSSRSATPMRQRRIRLLVEQQLVQRLAPHGRGESSFAAPPG